MNNLYCFNSKTKGMIETLTTQTLSKLILTIQELSLARDIESVTKIVRSAARELTGADGATFVLREENYCHYVDEDAISPLWKGKRFPIQECISGWAMLNKTAVVVKDIYEDERILQEAYKPTFVKSLAMVPIRTISPVGAIGNYWAEYHKPTEEELSLLQSLADITAVSLENIKIYCQMEEMVEKRTLELQQKNKEILDSITYAKRLQKAMFPSKRFMQKFLPESFLLYLPKDIVAGDFYWMEVDSSEEGTVIYFAIADCTGHGVPGAIVSVICSNALYRSFNEYKLRETGEILDKTREIVLETFARGEHVISDGMDISLCSINLNNHEVCWSGAYSSLFYTKDNKLYELKGHKESIGRTRDPSSFPTHKVQLKAQDMLYLLTDGFVDQFGGEKGKKFKSSRLRDEIVKIQSLPLDEQKEYFYRLFMNWKGQLGQVDDILLAGIRVGDAL